jgi:hypothetical protein
MALLQRKLVLKKSRGMHEKHARERKALTGHQGIFIYPCYVFIAKNAWREHMWEIVCSHLSRCFISTAEQILMETCIM